MYVLRVSVIVTLITGVPTLPRTMNTVRDMYEVQYKIVQQLALLRVHVI